MKHKYLSFSLFTLLAFGPPLESLAQDSANKVQTKLSTTTLSGYVSTSYRWTPTSGVGNDAYKYSGGEGHRDRFALDVISLRLNSPMGNSDWAAGYNVQMWLGPDADLLQTHGDLAQDSELAIKEAYVNLQLPVGTGLGLKVGVFDTIIGYEATDRNLNPHHSHSWGKTIEPTQHTGFLAEYQLYDWLGLKGGVANTWSPQINAQAANDNRFTLMGAATVTLPEGFGALKGSEFTAGYVNGRPSRAVSAIPLVYQNFYFGGKIPTPIDKIQIGAAWDVQKRHGDGNDDSVIGGYLSYQATDLLELNVRGEMFDSGATLSGLTPAVDSDGWSITTTANYRLWENATARFEYRMDHTDEDVSGKTSNHTLIWNMIYNF
jgi:hypothetical protein